MNTLVRYAFDPKHSDVLAICCSDGRYIRALEELLRLRGIDGHDLMALPGGPAQLCRESSSYSNMSVYNEALEFLMRSHRTRQVVLVTHADCGYYRNHFGRVERERQEQDLRRVASMLHDRSREVQIFAFFALPNPQSGEVVFDDVTL